jgi:hypothetical protein
MTRGITWRSTRKARGSRVKVDFSDKADCSQRTQELEQPGLLSFGQRLVSLDYLGRGSPVPFYRFGKGMGTTIVQEFTADSQAPQRRGSHLLAG